MNAMLGPLSHTLVAEERSAHVDLLAADDHHLLAVQQLLGHGGSETTEQVALAVNGHDLRCERAMGVVREQWASRDER